MTDTKLAVQENQIQEELKNFIFGNYTTPISDVQMAMALKLCKEYNLSPLRREIHFLPFKNNKGSSDLQPVIAYTEYLKKAQMTGNLNGWEYEIGVSEGEKKDMRCRVTIYRKDREYPLKHTVWFSEVVQKTSEGKPNKNRANKAKFMIMKVAIAQGMRLAFPEDLGAMPYEEAEARNVIEGKTEPKEEPSITTTKIVQEVEHTGLPDRDLPEMDEVRRKTLLNELQSAWTKKMGIDKTELIVKWLKKAYGVETSKELNEAQIGEMKFEIQDKTAEQLVTFINGMAEWVEGIEATK